MIHFLRMGSLLVTAFLAHDTARAQPPASYPVTEGDYVAHDFKFKSGEQLPRTSLALHDTR